MSRAHHWRSQIAATLAMAFLPGALAAFDLSQVVRTRLDNGLTVLVLEEHALPLVSVQMLYKVGARDEVTGRTGLAHFVEHMAFRATERFPGTEVVSRIYGVGGEWHAYTWIDQTTYYETVPSTELPLVLDIEADRMARLLLPADEVEAERGAVLAELHGYENDPATVLKDAVLATSFLHHPYRNNTIGWPSDVERLTRDDIEAFYRAHYRPANAVLTVVGDVEAGAVLAAVRERFGALPGGEPSPPPRTVEPPQLGERRVTLRLPRGAGRFEIAYRAPAASSPDYPAFLLLQELLGGSGGVNFLQATFGTEVDGTYLLGKTGVDMVTWFPPSARPYVLTIAGDRGERSAEDLERVIESRLAMLRTQTFDLVEAALDHLLDELIFDIETTEDAAHQLAFFEGLGALDVLLDLPARLARVTPEDVRRAAARYLQPWQRTVGWVESPVATPEAPGEAVSEAEDRRPTVEPASPASPAAPTPIEREPVGALGTPSAGGALAEPVTFRLKAGLPVIFQRSTLSPTGYLLLLFPRTSCAPGQIVADDPVWRHSSYGSKFLLRHAWRSLGVPHLLRACATPSERTAQPPTAPGAAPDPGAALAGALGELLGLDDRSAPAARPRLLVLTGDFDPTEARQRLETAFGDVAPGTRDAGPAPRRTLAEKRVQLGGLAQARLGYAVPAPSPREPAGDAWRMLLYILSHDYEGRLGVEAITRRGLVYHIESAYHCDGDSAWISLSTGVDPAKLPEMRELLQSTLAGLRSNPPTDAEIEEARRHLLGRRLTGAQSNQELAERLARDAVCFGGPLSAAAYRERLERIGRDEVLAAVPGFLDGGVAVVE